MEALFYFRFLLCPIAFAVQPGVIAFEALRRGIRHGFTAALHVELGSLLGDGRLGDNRALGRVAAFPESYCNFGFGAFWLRLALALCLGGMASPARGDVVFATAGETKGNHLVAGAMLSLSNPQNITFWVGMSGTIIGIGFLDPQPIHLLVFFAGFMIAQVCWCFFFAAVVEFGRRLLSQRLFRYINLACAVFLALLGLTLLRQTLEMSLALL